MILYTLIALSLLTGTAFTIFLDLIDKWYDAWILLVSYLGFFVVYVIIFLIFIAIYVSFINMKKEPKPTKFCGNLIKRVCELLIQIFKIKIHVRGMELLPEDKKFLFVSNHISMFDPIVCIWLFRHKNISFILKDSIMKIPAVNRALHKDLHLALDRSNNRQGLEVILKSIKLIKEDKKCVFVYPEGTRSKDGELKELHSGTFKVAEKAKCPIVVLTIINTNKISKRSLFKSTNVYVDVAKVINYEEYKDLQTNEIGDKVYEVMKDSLNELSELKY